MDPTMTPSTPPTTTPAVTPAASLRAADCQDNDVVQGHIVSQAILMANNGTPYLSIQTRVDSRLADPKRPQGSMMPFTHPFDQSISVFLSASPDREWTEEDYDKLGESLAGLGFVGEDIRVLDPSHPQHLAQGNLVGRRVFLRTYTNAKQKRIWVVKHYRPFETKPAATADLNTAHRNIGGRLNESLKKARSPFQKDA
jgi:hypothetical protein